ncbi:magnesium transporter CorA family protein [Microlunatus panaciterrae]
MWSRGKIIADNLYGDDLADVLQHDKDAAAWWVLPREAGGHLHDLARALDLDDAAIDDLTADDRRTKFEQLAQNRLLVTSAVSFDATAAELITQPISMVLSERAIVCLADPAAGAFNPAARLAARADEISADGVERALQVLLTGVVISYEEAVGWLEEASDRLADALFEERPLTKNEQLWAFRLRSMLSQLRRLTEPMRSVVTEVSDSFADRAGRISRQWAVLKERHTRVASAADSLREALSSVFDTSLALADLRMNQVMKKLSGWAAIIAVPTLVTGFVGMNVLFPLDGTEEGFWLYLVIMVAGSLALYALFKRIDWV